MNCLKKFQARFRALFARRKLDARMNEEMRSHIELQTQENIEAGMSPEEARYTAVRQFGHADGIKEVCREQREGFVIRQSSVVCGDVRFAFRQLLKNPGFTAVAVLTLALAIGANTAIFSVINGVLLKPLPYDEPGQIVNVWERAGDGARKGVAGGAFTDWKEHSTVFQHLAVIHGSAFNLTGEGQPERINGLQVSASLLDLLRVRALLGRGFLPEDDKLGNDNKVIVLAHRFWQRRFGGDTTIVGRTLRLNRDNYTVIGVLPPRSFGSQKVDFLVPFVFGTEKWQESRGDHRFTVLGRLKPEVTREQASAELNSIKQRLQSLYPKWKEDWGVSVVPTLEQVTGQVKPSLYVLLGAVAFVLLIACANVANLLLAKASTRQREMAIRAALGASRWRTMRHLLTESVLLALVGGGLGLALAFWGVRMLSRLSETTLPRVWEVAIDGRVLAASLLASLLTGLIFGSAPAWQLARSDVNNALKEGGRTSPGRFRNRLRSGLIVSEVALALVLLVGAGLLFKSFYRLQAVQPGYDSRNVLALDLSLDAQNYPDGERRATFLHQIFQQIKSLPGVESVGMATTLPLIGWGYVAPIKVEGRVEQPEFGYTVAYDFIAGDYFRSMGIPVLGGRVFAERDNSTNAPRVAIINEALVRKIFPGEDPIGKQINFWDKTWEVVGVVGGVRHDGLDGQPNDRIYLSQAFCPWMGSLVVRTSHAPMSLADPVRKAIQSLDPDQPVANLRTLKDMLADSIGQRRLTLLLLGIFSGAALVLAAIGLYGVMSYAVTQRTNEIGIRMALGAQRRDVLRLIVRHGLLLTVFGLVVGFAGCLALTRFLAKQLYEVGTTDPAAFTIVSLVLVAVAFLAAYIPARRATKVDPMVALRCE
ncbi:MAG: ABC transporter permease [Verrucomicrobiales bacterium]|nr:ABC transporter permease [Verrucomicrobiales bacterium]